MPRVRWTPEEEKRLLNLIAAGKSWTLISGMLKRSMKSVKLHAKTLRLVGAKKNEAEGEGELLPIRAQRLCPRFWNGASVGRQREGPYRFTRQLEKEEALPRSTDNHVCRPNATCPYSALLTSRMRGAEDSIRLR